MSKLKLEFKPAWSRVSINSKTGAVILQEEKEALLYKFSQHQDGSFSKEWRRQCPENKCWKRSYLTDAGDIILQDSNYHTFLFDQDMQLIDSWQYRGDLIACLPGPRAVYAVKKGEGYVVDIRDQYGEVLQLKPDESTWKSNLSIYDDVARGKPVVLDCGSNTLDIFSEDGKYLIFVCKCM